METTLQIAEGAASNDPDVGLRAVAALRALAERLELLQVQQARELGWSWQDIASRLGVTKQTVDRQALAFIGIDLDIVRARIEAAFGPDALTRALPAACRSRRPAWGKGPLAELMRRRRRRRARRNAPLPAGSPRQRPASPGPAP